MKEVWRCPKCKVEVVIDREGKSKQFTHKMDLNRPQMTFPTHPDCELVKPVGKMIFANLQKVRDLV